jgi:DNA-binding NtrC family response regulator
MFICWITDCLMATALRLLSASGPRVAGLPIILIPGFTQPDLIALANKVEKFEIIDKPFSLEAISKAVIKARHRERKGRANNPGIRLKGYAIQEPGHARVTSAEKEFVPSDCPGRPLLCLGPVWLGHLLRYTSLKDF